LKCSKIQSREKSTNHFEREEVMKSKKLSIVCAACLALILVASSLIMACAPAPTPAKTLKIGAMYSLTGDMSTVEILLRDGAVLCQEWINEKGGITINGEKYLIELVIEDTKSTADGAVAAATKLVAQDQVKFIIGLVRPDMTIASSSVTEPAGVLRSLDWDGNPDTMSPKTPYTFRPVLAGGEMISVCYDYLVEAYPDVKTVAILNPDEPGGQGFTQASKAIAAAHGLTVVASEFHLTGTEDYYPTLTKLLAAKPDALDLGTGNPLEAGLKFKQARELGFTGPIFNISPVSLDGLLEMAGKDFCYDYFNAALDMQSPTVPPMMKELQKRWEAKFGTPFQPNFECFQGWDTLWCLTQAIEAAQSLDPAVVKTAWENMESIETCYGTGHMGGLQVYGIKHLVVRQQCISRLEKGQVELIKWYMPVFP
jgi:branched-chain amino acid transport system substrate-binding protein